MSAGEQWTDETVLRESERWVYVSPDGVCTGEAWPIAIGSN